MIRSRTLHDDDDDDDIQTYINKTMKKSDLFDELWHIAWHRLAKRRLSRPNLRKIECFEK